MSLYGMMRTGVSGMNGQSNRLSTVADNIANSNTAGYKRAKTEFSTLVVPNGGGSYNSGGVTTDIRYQISTQGVLNYTTSVTDLAVDGDGFFIVQNGSGTNYLTRSGSFVPDGEGRLVNAAGFYLTGYSFANGTPSATANGFGGLEVVQIGGEGGMTATPSTRGEFSANLPSTAEDVAAGELPSDNVATSKYTAKSSLVAYDNLGSEVMLDVYFTKTADNTWEVTVFNKADAASGGTTSFPYANPPGALTTGTLDFDPTTGKLTAGGTLSMSIPNGATLELDLGGMTQLSSKYAVDEAIVDGNGPSAIDRIEISTDGVLSAIYENGSVRQLYRIPLATVASPDRLNVLSGNVYSQSNDSGDVRIGFSNEGGLGKMVSQAVESSNVDIAQELTDMIESQRNYTANSKVFQTGSELLDVLVNLKR
ncbi:flagellar hook protein FlgE [Mesorhizobium sp. L-8-10]|uniref:flagellar hook protein FlgE n=1 Tax=unclassified Mesorhizobium TaxID=325217 RepID=UPI001927D4A7|nr:MULTISPECIES: flagellar hook protein FlgE [unclassified Mesorhizobium]BCH23140.1 flagellar hook protein FlgE [Mesorhizobium sp. L-8-3]BCH30949.1 flagellar hook protein FlgE [Mesorhizobium sp. L-8-10]